MSIFYTTPILVSDSNTSISDTDTSQIKIETTFLDGSFPSLKTSSW